MSVLLDDITATLECLPEAKQRAVLEYARRLAESTTDRREALRSLRGSISFDDGERMLKAIAEGCEQIDAESW